MYLAALATEARAYNTAFGILSDLIARGYDGATSADFLAMVFPLEHLDEIRKQSGLNDLDPVLVLSLIKQESAFDKGAISSTGALGLMQLMPATASDTDPSVDRADLVEPSTNVRVGTKYLKHLLTRFNGNIVLALAGYNAGPNAADRWFREQGSKRGMLDFIETIPYKETREYVASIIRNYYWYSRKLTPNEPSKPLSFFWNAYNPNGGPAIGAPPADASASASASPGASEPAAAPTAQVAEPAPPRTPVPLLPVEE
jgi:soluble lytic murein transglycosylase